MHSASWRPSINPDEVELSVTRPEYLDRDKSEPLLLTVREAAMLMRIGRDTAYALVAEGRIPSVRLGRHIRIPRASLIAHLEREADRPTARGS
jgi:excisionase family DNA binding protein